MKVVNGNRLIAICWWTFAYVLAAGAVFALFAAGDCLQGAEGAACRDQNNSLTSWLVVSEVLAYPILTWLIFIRSR
jgi:hypothetical protein